LRVKGDLQLSAGRNGELVCRGDFGANFHDSVAVRFERRLLGTWLLPSGL
jgi:hypothetical protein